MTPFELTDTYLILDPDSNVEQVEGGGPFWARLASDHRLVAQLDDSRLVSAYRTTDDWTNWERHPAGEEVIIATGGRFAIRTEDPDSAASATIVLHDGQTIIMPAGVWHTVDVDEPGVMLTITAGKGTEHRDR